MPIKENTLCHKEEMNSSEASSPAYTPLGDGHITELLNGSTSGSAEDSDTSGSQGIKTNARLIIVMLIRHVEFAEDP